MALLAGPHLVFQGAHDIVIRNLVGPHPLIRHVAVGAGNVGVPVGAVPGVELVFRVPDKAEFIAGDVLLPLPVGRIAAQHFDNILHGDVPHLAALPGEEDIDGFHLGVFGYDVGDVALGAHQAPHILPTLLGDILTHVRHGLFQRRLVNPQGHVFIVMAVHAGHTQLLVLLGDLGMHVHVGIFVIIRPQFLHQVWGHTATYRSGRRPRP